MIEQTEYLKKVNSHIIQTISEEGELLDTETKEDHIIVGDAGEFFQLYSSIISVMEKNLGPMDVYVLAKIFMYCNRENLVGLSKTVRAEISTALDVSNSAITKAITHLVSAKVLIRPGQFKDGTYRINPRYFWKSDSMSRKKTLKYVLKVECRDC